MNLTNAKKTLQSSFVVFRFNDMEYAWVGEENWVYEKTFFVPEEAKKYSQIVLNFEGLDTVADVLVNNHHVGSSDNMFVR